MNSISAKRVWTSSGWKYNACVHFENGVIDHISQNASAACDVPTLVPGMIELHVHGSLGFEVLDAEPDTASDWLKRLAKHGVTGVLPSPASAPLTKMHDTVAFFDNIMDNPIKNSTKVLGLHLEGPFLNIEKKGGMDPECIVPPSIDAYQTIANGHEKAIKLITVAPEMDGALELISYLSDRGVHINAGHTNATAAQMRKAIAKGLDGVTHFFNASRGIHHREPGLLVAALLDPNVYCEAVCDQIHIAPEIIQLLVQAAGPKRVTVITDAVQLTGMPDGIYGPKKVENGSPRLLDGTLIGSRYLMDDCVRGLIEIGIDPWDVFCMTSYTPAKRIGMRRLGDIAPQFAADLVAMDDTYHVVKTIIDGETVE